MAIKSPPSFRNTPTYVFEFFIYFRRFNNDGSFEADYLCRLRCYSNTTL